MAPELDEAGPITGQLFLQYNPGRSLDPINFSTIKGCLVLIIIDKSRP
jgi:hypothetical protein